MKKVLLGTTAMVAAGMLAAAPSAIAADQKATPVSLGVSGYMEQWFGYTAQDGKTDQDYTGFDQKSDTEVHFKGSTKLDNGLMVAVTVEMEGATSGGPIDESYMEVSGSFGKFILGSENSAQYLAGAYAPSDYGIGLISGDQPNWVRPLMDADGNDICVGAATCPGYWRNPMGSVYLEPLGMDDTQGVTYFTPRFEGVQVGVSYVPEVGAAYANAQPNRDTGDDDAITGAINYKNSFGNATVSAAIGYGTVTRTEAEDDSDPTALNMGLVVNVGGFGIGAAYGAFDDSGAQNGESYAVGASYDMAPWGLSLVYFHGERDGTGSASGGDLMNQAAGDTVHLSAMYALGPGVSANGTLGHVTWESDDSALDETVNDVSGTYLVVGLKVKY